MLAASHPASGEIGRYPEHDMRSFRWTNYISLGLTRRIAVSMHYCVYNAHGMWLQMLYMGIRTVFFGFLAYKERHLRISAVLLHGVEVFPP